MTGSYFCVNDSATLVIEPMMIRKFYVDKDTIPNQIYIDTIFSLHRGDVLKKYKGFYFLNSSSSTNNWEVKKVAMRNGILTIGNINSEEEILAMEKITGVLSDSTKPYVAKPTKQQLKQFLKANGFKEEEIYVRE